jgi:hypothetical protein
MTTNKLAIFLVRGFTAIVTIGTFLFAMAVAGSSHNTGYSSLFLFLISLVFGYTFYLTFKKEKTNS